MKLQDQVISFDQSKRLAELGITSKSIFYHVWNKHVEIGYEGLKYYQQTGSFLHRGKVESGGLIVYYPAYTVAELSAMLPTLGIKRCKSNNGVGQDYHWLEFRSQDWSDVNEAQLLAKFLIYLLENNLLTSQEVNERLRP